MYRAASLVAQADDPLERAYCSSPSPKGGRRGDQSTHGEDDDDDDESNGKQQEGW
jgi:hypothetical protein